MQFEEFIGNVKVVERLQKKLREERFPQALIFAGPEGVGKRTCVLLIAKALNCPQRGPGEFCDTCNQCRKIDSGVHPDVLTIGLEEDASEIKIAQIRDLLHTLGLRPLEGARKIFIIDPADSMNPSAANALLKGLEEPPEDSHFFLLASNPQSLLATVRSRSQTYPFAPLTLQEMRRFETDEMALRWARGSVGILKTLDLEPLRRQRENALDFLEMAIRAREEQFRDLIATSGDLARSKNEFDSNVEAITILMEDVLYIREGLSERIVNIDLEARLKKLAGELAPDQISRIANFLRTLEVYLTTHVNRQMMTDVLAITSNGMLAKIANDIPIKSR